MQYNPNKQTFQAGYPVRLDVGAEQDTQGQKLGVTIAVVDSGIYFNSFVSDDLQLELQKQFGCGQADFVGTGLPSSRFIQNRPAVCESTVS